MAIEFECPNCGERYRLRDDVGGKKAKCRNPQCGRLMLIPAPHKATVPPTTPPPPDVEAAALSALADTPEQKEEVAAEQAIPMTCQFCQHKWTEPLAKAGKNVLCPNEECRQRIKVPVPKKQAPTDWREGVGSGKPTLAKENFEKPKDIVSSEAATVVTKKAWTEGGGADQELEPIPLARKLRYVALALGLLVAIGAGIWYLIQSRTDTRKDRLIEDALKEYETAAADIPQAEAPLGSAILHMAAGEYTVRQAKELKDLEKARDHLAKARIELQLAAIKDPNVRAQVTPERNALVCELAMVTLELGGSDEQVKEQVRYRWRHEVTNRQLRINEGSQPTVQEELRRTLDLLRPAETDLRMAVLRRLTRELVKRGQHELAADLPPLLFTGGPEQEDARAVVAMQIYRSDRTSNVPQREFDKFKNDSTPKDKGAKDKGPKEKGGKDQGIPPYVQGLLLALSPPGAPPPGVSPPPGSGGSVNDTARLAYVCQHLLQDRPEEALKLAARDGSIEVRLRAMILCAEWSNDPTPAAEAAKKAIGTGTVFPVPARYLVMVLAQVTAAGGQADKANELTEAIPDEGLKAWAKAEVVRCRLVGNSQPADEAWAALPEDLKKVRAGHAWGRFWVARQNAKLSGNRSKELAAIESQFAWPRGTIHPFGMAGIALGLQDRDQ